MTHEDISKRIQEFAGTRVGPLDDPLDQVEAALFIEEVFRITLTDDDMTEARLGSIEAMKQLVLERLELI